MWIWTDVGPVLPWLITSVSVAYVAYIHWKLRKQFRRKPSDPSPKINPSIDKHKSKVKHVFRGEHLEKEEFDSGVKITTGADIEDLDTEDIDADDKETTEGGRPRGRKSAYSYFVSECAAKEDNPLCQTSAERRIFAEFAKRCAHMWKKLTEEEKQHFHQLSDEDKQRYELEMKTFRRQQHHKRSRHSSSRSKSPKKEPLIVEEEEDLNSDVMDMAFDLFANEEMPIVRTQRPSIDTNNEEILTELVQRWNRSDQAFKDKFLDRIRLQSVAFNKSFSQSIRDDDESGVGPEDDPNVCKDGVNCGSDEEVVLEEDCGLNSKSSKV